MRKFMLALMIVVALGLVVTCQKQQSEPVAEAEPQAAEQGMVEPVLVDLIGTNWVAEDIAGQGVSDAAQSTLMFLEDGQASGSGACNRFMVAYQIEGQQIAFGHMTTTKMACLGAVMDQEKQFLDALATADRVELTDEGLLMLYPTKGEPTKLSPMPAEETQ
jgi:putative lipoprotein